MGKNHGIKEKNILGLLLPIRLSMSDINQTWLATIDSFGSDQGNTAHRSVRAYQPPDPGLGVVDGTTDHHGPRSNR